MSPLKIAHMFAKSAMKKAPAKNTMQYRDYVAYALRNIEAVTAFAIQKAKLKNLFKAGNLVVLNSTAHKNTMSICCSVGKVYRLRRVVKGKIKVSILFGVDAAAQYAANALTTRGYKVAEVVAAGNYAG